MVSLVVLLLLCLLFSAPALLPVVFVLVIVFVGVRVGE